MAAEEIDLPVWVLRGSSFMSARRGRVRTEGAVLRITDGADVVLSAPAAQLHVVRSEEYTIVESSNVPIKMLFWPAIGLLRWLVPTWAVVALTLCVLSSKTDNSLNDVFTYVGGIMFLALFPIGVAFRPTLSRAEDRRAGGDVLATWIDESKLSAPSAPLTPQHTTPPISSSSRLMALTMGFFGGIPISVVLRILIGLLPDLGALILGICVGVALVVPIAGMYCYYRRVGARLEVAERLAAVGKTDDSAPSFIAYGLPILIGYPIMLFAVFLAT